MVYLCLCDSGCLCNVASEASLQCWNCLNEDHEQAAVVYLHRNLLDTCEKQTTFELQGRRLVAASKRIVMAEGIQTHGKIHYGRYARSGK